MNLVDGNGCVMNVVVMKSGNKLEISNSIFKYCKITKSNTDSSGMGYGGAVYIFLDDGINDDNALKLSGILNLFIYLIMI
jgi:hypothetical protein